ncbi:PAS domain S-box protein [Cognatilysobacter terrigena]|uniref:PAS domain S-box protein n=1 Tax=Cognatilysobacter terrigena TaxID=2488749 RepID=UPI00106113A8|nr:PAS domain S-box protein [Lysobacter terrigena]
MSSTTPEARLDDEPPRRRADSPQGFLLRLSDALRLLDDPADVRTVAARTLGEYLGVAGVAYGEMQADGEHKVIRHAYASEGTRPLDGVLRLGDFGAVLPARLRAGHAVVVRDLAAETHLTDLERTRYDELDFAAFAAVPLIRSGRLVGDLLVHQSTPRDWSDDDIDLLRDTAERVWAAVERARAEAEREAAHVELARQSRFIEGMLASLPDYAYAFDREHRFAYTNHAMQALFGMTGDDMRGKTFADLGYPADLASHLDADIARVLDTGETVEDEVFYTSPIGVAGWFHYSWGPVFDADGRVELVVGTSRDTTERRRMEERVGAGQAWQAFLLELGDALRQCSEPSAIGAEAVRRLGAYLGAERVLFSLIDVDAAVVEYEYVNGVEPLRGRRWKTPFADVAAGIFMRGDSLVVADIAADPRIDPETRQRYEELNLVSMAGVGLVDDGRLVAAFGAHRSRRYDWTEDEVALIREVGDRTWSAIKRATAEAALQHSERRLAAMFANAAVGLAELEDSGRFVHVNDELCRIVARSQYELTTLGVADVTHPDDLARTLDVVVHARDTGHTARIEKRCLRPDGSALWTETSLTPLRAAAGQPGNLLAVTIDLTERKAAEAAVVHSQAQLRRVLQGIPQLVWRAVELGRWTWASRQWAAFTGQNERDSLEHGWLDAVHPEDRDAALQAWAVAPSRGVLDVEFRLRRQDGVWLWHHTRSLPERDPSGRIVEWLGTCTDVQELKQLQAQQEVLVAELQHRTRNLIGVVRSIADRTAAGSETMDEFRNRFRDRMAALGRVQGLLSQRDAGRRVTFDQLLQAELGGVGVVDRSRQLVLDGPAGVGLQSESVQTFALGLHELATNAVKYGALSTPQGCLHVHWRVEDDARGEQLCVDWHESGVSVPEHARSDEARWGYGRELIERALPYQLNAETRYALDEDGVRCTIRVPLRPPAMSRSLNG